MISKIIKGVYGKRASVMELIFITKLKKGYEISAHIKKGGSIEYAVSRHDSMSSALEQIDILAKRYPPLYDLAVYDGNN
ncbi:hypothetical protein [Anaerosinus sp.]|uniref:hypothetical protein n=1 Tax=Selenobaculum sp. TaxID=3074374 RepID=UPI003AB18162